MQATVGFEAQSSLFRRALIPFLFSFSVYHNCEVAHMACYSLGISVVGHHLTSSRREPRGMLGNRMQEDRGVH